VAQLIKHKIYAEQFVFVTDEGENSAPYLVNAWKDYCEKMQVVPSIIIVQVGGSNERFAQGLQAQGIELIRYQFGGDYYALPNLLPLLALPSKAELVSLILEYPLPERPKAGV
jgi:hypothetical protein